MGYSYKSSRGSSAAQKYARTRSGQRRTNTNRSSRRPAGQYIDPARFVQVATFKEEEPYESMHTFADFNLIDTLQRNLIAKNYITPSPIQDQAIPVALTGKDIVGLASTGTGKTAAFALPILQKLLTDQKAATIIVAPTRELAQQIEKEMQDLARGSNLFGVLLIGGASMSYQLRSLQRNPRIIIGTPGRIKDHLKRGSLKLNRVTIVALDEVDRMLDMGFLPDVRFILESVTLPHQSLFFSATMDTRIRTLIESFTSNPVSISLKASAASDNVHQDVIHYDHSHEKIDKLHDLLINPATTKAIVFDETQRGVEKLSKELVERGFSAGSIHGGKNLGQRRRALESFKRNETKILVATDVAARGIDVADITHVVNFSIPQTYDDYVHRIGRAGRAGKIGYALTFVERNK